MIHSAAMITSVFTIGARAARPVHVRLLRQPSAASSAAGASVHDIPTSKELQAGMTAAQLALKLFDMVRLGRDGGADPQDDETENTHLARERQVPNETVETWYDPIDDIQGLGAFQCDARIHTILKDCRDSMCYNTPVYIHIAAMLHSELRTPKLIDLPTKNNKDNDFVRRSSPEITPDVRVPEGSYIGVYNVENNDAFIHGMMAVGYTSDNHLLIAGVKNQPLTGNGAQYADDFGIYDLTAWMEEHAIGDNKFTDGDGKRRLSLKYKPLYAHDELTTPFGYSMEEYGKKYFANSGCCVIS